MSLSTSAGRERPTSDPILFVLALLLAGLGLVMVYSASSVTAYERFGDSAYFLKRQVAFVVAGLALMLLVQASDYRKWVRASGWILGGAVTLLLALHVPGLGVRVGGALRWLSLGGFRLQPGELAKLACILYLSWALVRKGRKVNSFSLGVLPILLVGGGLAALLMTQPDFGNAVVILLISGTMLFLAGGRVRYLAAVACAGLPLGVWAILGEGYRRRRLLAFLNPWDDPRHTSYQIVQSFTAFFSGGFFGRGLGNSQEKLYYLPEVHTDFVASVVGEELGFIGIACLIGVLVVLVVRGYRVALRAPDPEGFLLAAGCSTLIGLQAVLNLMVVTGLVPTKGLPLPFVSHGGSSLLATFLACGFIQSVAARARLDGAPPDSPWLRRWGMLDAER
jgi:cell division protein FtsW